MADAPSGIAKRRLAARTEANPVYVQRRQELVRAAAEVFKAKGLAGASLGDIAAAAGADRASLYYYVASKEELFHEVVREAVEANLAAARELVERDGPVPDKLRELVIAIMRSYEANYPILYVFIQENLTHAPEPHAEWAREMRRINREYENLVIGLVEAGYAEGSLRQVAPAWVVAYGLMGMVGWTSRWFQPGDPRADGLQVGRAFADMLLLGLDLDPAPGG